MYEKDYFWISELIIWMQIGEIKAKRYANEEKKQNKMYLN